MLHKITTTFLDFLLPPRCLSCEAQVTEIHLMCATCWADLDFLTHPQCVRCGFPFELDYGEDTLCAGCIHEEPIFDKARSVFSYTSKSKQMILRLKHGDATHLAPAFARMMYQAHGSDLDKCDVIIPVPIHTRRLWVRWYNQAGLMANHLGKLGGKPIDYFSLKRIKNTPPQGKLSKDARITNVKGSIAIQGDKIKGKHIALIDDVYTTGATVNECARILKRHGAKSVDIFTLARVLSQRSD